MPDGIAVSNRVDTTTERKLHAKVVDNILNSRVLFSRLMGRGKPFSGKTFDYTLKLEDSQQGEFFSGNETLATQATDTTATMSYAHTGFSQPVVIPMLEAFANTGEEATIDLTMFKTEEAAAEAVQRLGSIIYTSLGDGKQPLGLNAIVDDGTDKPSIGGLSRATYPTLASDELLTTGLLTLAKLGGQHDAASAAGLASEEPTIHATNKGDWTNYEQLLAPQVRAEYQTIGYNRLPVRGDDLSTPGELKGGAGFTALTYRGRPVIKDDACPAGTWYMLNENYLEWRGRTIVPAKFDDITSVNLGTPKTIEGVAAAPTKYHGFFFQKFTMMPQQAALVGRYYVIGQLMSSQPRRHTKLSGITGV